MVAPSLHCPPALLWPVVCIDGHGVLLAQRDCCFVVHRLIFVNVLTNSAAHCFSFLLSLLRSPCASARVGAAQVLGAATSDSPSPRWWGEDQGGSYCFLFVRDGHVCLFALSWGLLDSSFLFASLLFASSPLVVEPLLPPSQVIQDYSAPVLGSCSRWR